MLCWRLSIIELVDIRQVIAIDENEKKTDDEANGSGAAEHFQYEADASIFLWPGGFFAGGGFLPCRFFWYDGHKKCLIYNSRV